MGFRSTSRSTASSRADSPRNRPRSEPGSALHSNDPRSEGVAMRRFSWLVGVFAVLWGPLTLVGQAPGLPVRNAGIGTGIQLGFDLGISRGVPVGESSTETSTGLGGTISAGLGPLGASLFVVRFDEGGP